MFTAYKLKRFVHCAMCARQNVDKQRVSHNVKCISEPPNVCGGWYVQLPPGDYIC